MLTVWVGGCPTIFVHDMLRILVSVCSYVVVVLDGGGAFQAHAFWDRLGRGPIGK